MSEKKAKLEKGTTPFGVAVYPRLNKPDTKFVKEGVYTTRLRLTAEQAQPLIDKITEIQKAFFAETKASLAKGDGKQKAAAKALKFADDKPWRAAVDDEGEETGDFEFNFKMKASYTLKDGTVKTRKPALFDAKGNKANADIWGGSTISVAFEYMPFYTAKVGVGVSLRLQAVQVKELVSGGERSAEGYGFGKTEGYEASDDDLPSTTKANDEGDGSDSGEADDEQF